LEVEGATGVGPTMARTRSRRLKRRRWKCEVRKRERLVGGTQGNESGCLQGGGAAEHSHGGQIEGKGRKKEGGVSRCAVDCSALEPVVRCRRERGRVNGGEGEGLL
jgi:hypothetical protein